MRPPDEDEPIRRAKPRQASGHSGSVKWFWIIVTIGIAAFTAIFLSVETLTKSMQP